MEGQVRQKSNFRLHPRSFRATKWTAMKRYCYDVAITDPTQTLL